MSDVSIPPYTIDADDFKDTCDGLVIETNKDGTLKSANIAEANWTPKQREFVEKCLRAAAEQRGDGKDSKDGEKQEDPSLHKNTRSLKEEFGKSIAQGKAELRKVVKDPIRLVNDVYQAGKLIGQGKFRELGNRAALRVHDNLIAMGILPKNIEERIVAANGRIEKRNGIKNREDKTSYAARQIGKAVRDVTDVFNRLSGRTGSKAVQISSNSSGRSNGREGGHSK